MVKQCFVISSHLMKKELKNISDFTNDMHRMYSDLIENGKEYDNDSLIWRGHRVIFLLNYCCKFNTISLDEMVKRKMLLINLCLMNYKDEVIKMNEKELEHIQNKNNVGDLLKNDNHTPIKTLNEVIENLLSGLLQITYQRMKLLFYVVTEELVKGLWLVPLLVLFLVVHKCFLKVRKNI